MSVAAALSQMQSNARDGKRPFSAYPTYRPSGVACIETVPSHWAIRKVAHTFRTIGSGTTPASQSEEYYGGDVPWVTTSELRESIILDTTSKLTGRALKEHSALRLYPPGTLLFAMYGATIGRLGILGVSATVNQACCALGDSSYIEPQFAYYWLQMRRPVLIAWATGGGQPNLSQDDLREVRIPTPPLNEQRAIATFLDRETARIDALIAKKQRLIELLQEKRTALISHVVTKGLNADVLMKETHIAWIGRIPTHWTVLPLKRLSTRVDVGIAEAATHAYCDDGVPIIRSTNVCPNRIDTSDLLHIENWFAEKNHSKYLQAGDLVTVRTGYPGTTAVIPPQLHKSQCFTLVMTTIKNEHNPWFFSYFLNSHSGVTTFEREGWGSAQTNISVPIVAEALVVAPPRSEQDRIVDELSNCCRRYETLVDAVVDAIERLSEYRSALISAAVTGKIDVRSGCRGGVA